MMLLSKKIFYAVEALLYIAYNSGNDCVSSKVIAQKQGMQPRYLEQIMQPLVRATIVKGLRGPSGGYVLAREKRRISLYDICTALGESEATFLASIPVSTSLGKQVVAPCLNALYAPLWQQLKTVTLADLYEQAETRNVKKTAQEHSDFTI